jgi:hypothetical protein
MENPLIITIKQAIFDRYQQKYGHVTIDLDSIVPEPEQDHQAHVEFTIRKADSFVTRYYGTATIQDGQVHFDVMSI